MRSTTIAQIYRCPSLQTVLSDIEVDQYPVDQSTMIQVPSREKPVEFGVMHRFKYMLDDGSERYIQVDTTRPETILGDVAVAVHPEDSRYTEFHGKYVQHPFSKKSLPIVLDPDLVDMELGTGVVKITPSHDPNDFACALRHDLPQVSIMNPNGMIEGENLPKEFVGLNRFDARELMVEKLNEMELYLEKIDHPTSISRCSRSGDIIEPMLMPQWFVKTSDMAKAAHNAVASGSTAILPKSHEKTWYRWLDNIEDWCVSRQLWWGHRIPAYRLCVPDQLGSFDEFVVARSRKEAENIVESKYSLQRSEYRLEQEDDVLDTWFSSSLLPLSALVRRSGPCILLLTYLGLARDQFVRSDSTPSSLQTLISIVSA